jgi:hypothetical protein
MTRETPSQTARQIRGPAAVMALTNKLSAKLIVDPPLPEALARGLVVIQYLSENLRIVPVFGTGALDVSPRIGDLHMTLDDEPWHWVDASGEAPIIQGLPPGPHRLLVQLADPNHRMIDQELVVEAQEVVLG